MHIRLNLAVALIALAGMCVAAAEVPIPIDLSTSAYSRGYVQRVYVAYYGRPADPAGLNYWAARMDSEGQSLNAIIGAFGYSDEFNRRYGGLTKTQLVTKIFQQTLARDPDPAGLNWYVGELQAGRRTLQSITLDVLNGATTTPDSTVVANKLDVANHYTGKVATGCAYGSEQTGVASLTSVTSDFATAIASIAATETRCLPPSTPQAPYNCASFANTRTLTLPSWTIGPAPNVHLYTANAGHFGPNDAVVVEIIAPSSLATNKFGSLSWSEIGSDPPAKRVVVLSDTACDFAKGVDGNALAVVSGAANASLYFSAGPNSVGYPALTVPGRKYFLNIINKDCVSSTGHCDLDIEFMAPK
jgi:hypothetical protein